MARAGAGPHSWTAMREYEPPPRLPAHGRLPVTGRHLARVGVLLLTLGMMLLTSSVLNLAASARAQSPKRAVIVSGPVHSLTDRYLDYARAMADAAEAQGMEVIRIFHPNATVERVKNHASGADLFIYVGHGNGWPSAYGSLDESTKNGLGLDVGRPREAQHVGRGVQGRRLAAREHRVRAQCGGHPLAPLVCLRQRFVRHGHPHPRGRGRAHRQLRQWLPGLRGTSGLAPRLAARRGRHQRALR